MNLKIFQPRSLKTRVTVLTLVILLTAIWTLAFYASRMLREDMQLAASEQQFATVSVLADMVDEELDNRLRLLERIAKQISPATLGNTAALQALLEQRPILPILFNGGAFVTGIDGAATASLPLSTKRRGVNFIERDLIASALKEGKPTVSKPVIGKMLNAPIIAMAVPIRGAHGRIIGAMAGVINLSQPNFLDKVTEKRYGKTGGYFIVAKQYRLIISASDKNRSMQVFPAAGINPAIDRFIQGYDGSIRYVNPLGVEVLGSVKSVPAANWFLGAILPAEEAFAPIRAMLLRILLSTIILTLLAGGLTWWMLSRMLKRQLSPILAATKTLAALSETNQLPPPLQIVAQDEIGQLIGAFNRLLKTVGAREEALKESEQRYRNLFDSTLDGIYQVNADGFFIRMNKAGANIFGHETPDEMIGKSVLDYWRDAADRDVYQVELHRKKTLSAYPMKVRRSNGELRELEASSIIIEGKDGTFLGIDGILRDVTERKDREKIIEEKNAELERFTYTVSHDLKSPLVTIKTFLGFLEQDLANSDAEQAGNDMLFMSNAADKMARLLNELLELSRVGRVRNDPVRVTFHELVDEAMNAVAGSIAEKHVDVRVEDRDVVLHGDRPRFAEIWQNLIENAVKYMGDQTEPRIELGVAVAGQEAVFYVRDNGMGIDPRYRDKVFVLFDQLDPKSEGSGLGLALVKRIVEMYKGKVWLESEGLGKGTCFKFTLPEAVSS